jgi:hypothetical protein
MATEIEEEMIEEIEVIVLIEEMTDVAPEVTDMELHLRPEIDTSVTTVNAVEVADTKEEEDMTEEKNAVTIGIPMIDVVERCYQEHPICLWSKDPSTLDPPSPTRIKSSCIATNV